MRVLDRSFPVLEKAVEKIVLDFQCVVNAKAAYL